MSLVIPALSTEYLRVQVSALKNGATYNPTSDTVQFAFKVEGTNPSTGDWVNGSWETTSSNVYYARCLIGPVGATTLAAGTYVIWVKVTDNPEVPVAMAGTVTII